MHALITPATQGQLNIGLCALASVATRAKEPAGAALPPPFVARWRRGGRPRAGCSPIAIAPSRRPRGSPSRAGAQRRQGATPRRGERAPVRHMIGALSTSQRGRESHTAYA
eukprot:6188794-Pleurochrysis_carterae.AAC.2